MAREKLIFGSKAAKHWYSDFREPKDLDIIAKGKNEESTPELQYYFYGDSFQYVLDNNTDDTFVDPQFLYTIKAAHSNWNVFWEKTIGDIFFFQKKGLKIHDELYKLLMIDFTAFHGKAWASLKGKDSTTFFEDAVKRKYVHDTIHDAVAYGDFPLYYQILKSDKSVSCSKKKFDNLSEDDKLKLIREEVFVTALERYLIPNDFKYSRQKAYAQSLKKLITTMSSGWFSKVIIERYSDLVHYKDDYITRFKQNEHKLQLEEK